SAAQTCNDLAGIKAKYGNSLVIMGGWDATPHMMTPFASATNPGGVTEEEIRQSVRDAFDQLAPGGGYVWAAGFLSYTGDEEGMRKNEILQDEARTYSANFYK
ncbi:MAG: veratrol--corrinoid protein metyltransferase, partial [Coriobacteriia bacterium]|nr:veratrol--corrinoid protein metyltransferase [Coriobacteriia bacterium]